MSKDRAIYWFSVIVLLGVGLLIGQLGPVAIAAMVAVILAYRDSTSHKVSTVAMVPAPSR